MYDELTGLPGMTMLINEMSKLIDKSSANSKFAVAYLDIDNFRYINQTSSHKVGNELLKYISHNLETDMDDSYMVARIAGDTFAILFTDIQSATKLFELISNIKSNVCNIWSAYNYDFYVSFSMGISIYPENGKDIMSILQNAEIAMSIAKRQGKDILFFKEDLLNDFISKVQMVNEMQKGMDDQNFTLYYQPMFNLNTNKIMGVETLVRWMHPKKGMISPTLFIPIAEESKQIYILEKWIINHALQQKKQWEVEGFKNIELSINISSKTLESDFYFHEIERILLSNDVDFSKVIFEITETAFLYNIDIAIERISKLKKLGIKIALDDFGTGYSSMSHLKELPIDIIKVDRSFVKSIPNCEKDMIIIKNILSVAHDLNCKVIAEGIETEHQLNVLKQYSCDLGQGFLFYKPLSEENVKKLFD